MAHAHRIVLAGGLTPENVAEAIEVVRPCGVDVSSGVEDSPGVKNVDKVKRFLTGARSAFDKQ
jgi:phosphoribosylanthranilate isomerase